MARTDPFTDDRLPSLPDRLGRLGELASDLWWSWNPEGRELFRRLDFALWRQTEHNPIRMLQAMPPARLQELAADDGFVSAYDTAVAALDRARARGNTWWDLQGSGVADGPIAYFSAEFAFHQSLPIYAGGLGVLAADHCKEAADLGIPLVGVGFLYPLGYFRQQISSEGTQTETYVRLSWTQAPIEPATRADGTRCTVEVPLGNRTVHVATWRVRLGRVTVYLLDTDVEANAPWDRGLTARLYGGDREVRIQQEIVLGLGGVTMLRALGVSPTLWHLNEGHAGFVILQRIRDGLEQGLDFERVLSSVRETTIFTTHTPVSAGHDAFPFDLVESHLAGAWGPLGDHRSAFLALGSYDSGDGPAFNMTALALRSASRTNGVSALHGRVTRRMWADIWPDVPEDDRPVDAITNGIHLPTWLSVAFRDLLDQHLGPAWREHQDEDEYWGRLAEVPDEAIWAVRRRLSRYLLEFVRARARERWTRDHASPTRMMATGLLMEPDVLTIGFARRFTAYKRPELIFHDEARLASILTHDERPVQIVFAGKAHPADEAGKHQISRIVGRTLHHRFGGRIAFIGNYDVHVARYLVQGCDVWLNTPRKPMEASGTSGMKACVNGVPHLSVGDGWWEEGFNGRNGWRIEGAGPGDSPEAADAADAEALYTLLERDVVPAFYERDAAGVPTRWTAMVKEAIRSVAPRFSARRMLKEYAARAYGGASGCR